MGKLDGKVALITGASRGIGQGIAEEFAREGAKVVCAARTLHEGDHMLAGSLDRTVTHIREAGGTAIAVTADVSKEDDCNRMVAEAKAAFGPVDVLINNAALNYYIPVVDYPASRWMRAFAVNVHGPFMLSRAVLPDMIARRSGAIVNISSVGAIGPGRGPYPGAKATGGVMYGASKAALERFTQGLAQEVYEYGVTVACYSPGIGVATEGTVHFGLAKSLDDPDREPMSMMARAALLLATEPLDKVTGRVTYSQEILKEFGWISEGHGLGIDRPGSGFSRM
ncbi:MAG: SDR family NAD(P)-dependent oxidoreductase [Dehalococcoidia bacterium]|nr:MAG: SDR family NAD(P)-dependent oxidoreductase [Dehalococcoidia bacterium]